MFCSLKISIITSVCSATKPTKAGLHFDYILEWARHNLTCLTAGAKYGGCSISERLLSWCFKLLKQMEAGSSSPVGETMGKVRGSQAMVYNRKCKQKHSVTVVCRGGHN